MQRQRKITEIKTLDLLRMDWPRRRGAPAGPPERR
jgi:hypothetical protein